MGGAVEDSAGQVAKDADPAAKRAKEVGHSVADDAAEGAEGARGKAKGKATELKGQVGGLAPPLVLMCRAEVGTQKAPDRAQLLISGPLSNHERAQAWRCGGERARG